MAIVKIILEGNETEEEAKEALVKAFTHAETGIAHQETFHQPAGRATLEALERLHDETLKNIESEILALLSEEV